MIIEDLRCEYLVNPIGIDIYNPRLSWRLATDIRCAGQSAYQIQVAQEPDFSNNKTIVWDTGIVKSDQSVHHIYAGSTLVSRKRYFWRVNVWDEDEKESGWSHIAFWEMGLLNKKEWVAKWIDPEEDIGRLKFKTCPYLRRSFRLNQKPISARAYVTVHGVYELSVNGQVVGEYVLTPGFTSYYERLQYQTYDITELLGNGENVIGVILGDGWFRGKTGALSIRNVYGDRLALLLQVHINYADGEEQVIISDDSWKTSMGPIIKSDLKDGEIYDARLEIPGWDEPGFSEDDWKTVKVVDFGYDNLIAMSSSCIKRKEEFIPKVLITPNGEWVLDIGQNIAGRMKMKVKGARGTTIKLKHSETLDKDGNFTMANLLGPELLQKIFKVDKLFQEDQYTIKGDGWEIYEPRFTFHGFRYVKVEGFPGEPTPDNFVGIAIYSDMREIGEFECSHSLVNRLHENIKWSLKSNYLDIPTDCPQRERSGWVGDAQVFSQTSSLIMETAGFYSKWLKDLAADQRSDGMVPCIVPDPSKHTNAGIIGKTNGSAGFADAVVIIPWNIYQNYGDTRILESQYNNMKAWVNYMERHAKKNHWTKKLMPWLWFKTPEHYQYLWDSDYHWGEWQEPDKNQLLQILLNFLFSQPEVATAYYAYSSMLLSKISDILGNKEEATHYAELHEKVKAAWQKEFIKGNGRLKPDRQATYVRALAFELLPEDLRLQTAIRLVDLIKKNNFHIGTGFLSTTFINHMLTQYGYPNVAYKLLLQETRPSWLYPIIKGATTIWEFWDVIRENGTVKLGSMNHYSLGSIGSWLYQVVAGIRVNPDSPGYKNFSIQPILGGGLTYADAKHQSMYGEISVKWEIKNGMMVIKTRIPVNTTANVFLPKARLNQIKESGETPQENNVFSNIKEENNCTIFTLKSGLYEFSYPYEG